MPTFAEVNISTEGVVVIGVLLAALSSAVGVLFKLAIKTKDEQLAVWKSLAGEAISVTEVAADRERRRKGLGPAVRKADVEPESNSPPTEKQQETADAATQRARLVAARLDLGVKARRPGTAADDLGDAEDPVLPPAVVGEIVDAVVDAVVARSAEVLPDKTAEAVVEKLDERAGK